MAKTILGNAFSIQMLAGLKEVGDEVTVKFRLVEKPENFDAFESSVGHQDTANLLGVPMVRSNTRLNAGEEMLIAQFMGGRLPEGATSLPEGITLAFVKAEVN
jgi:hypothetical protein